MGESSMDGCVRGCPSCDPTYRCGQPLEGMPKFVFRGWRFRGAHTITLGRKPSGNLTCKMWGGLVEDRQASSTILRVWSSSTHVHSCVGGLNSGWSGGRTHCEMRGWLDCSLGSEARGRSLLINLI